MLVRVGMVGFGFVGPPGINLAELAAKKHYGPCQPGHEAALVAREEGMQLLAPFCLPSALFPFSSLQEFPELKGDRLLPCLKLATASIIIIPTLTTGWPNPPSGCFPPLCFLIQSQAAGCRAGKEETSKKSVHAQIDDL